MFAFENFNYLFMQTQNNLIIFNYVYYSFPFPLEKNIIQNDKEIYESFRKFLRHVYSSKILKDIFYLSDKFNEFLYPLDDKEIFDELLDYTTFAPFDNRILQGFTKKEIPGILIGVNL